MLPGVGGRPLVALVSRNGPNQLLIPEKRPARKGGLFIPVCELSDLHLIIIDHVFGPHLIIMFLVLVSEFVPAETAFGSPADMLRVKLTRGADRSGGGLRGDGARDWHSCSRLGGKNPTVTVTGAPPRGCEGQHSMFRR